MIVNYDAMQDDPVYEQLQKTKEARTMFLAQQMTGDGAPLSGEPDESGAATQAAETEETSTAAQTFLEFMAKSPRERYYEMILKEKGLTKEQTGCDAAGRTGEDRTGNPGRNRTSRQARGPPRTPDHRVDSLPPRPRRLRTIALSGTN